MTNELKLLQGVWFPTHLSLDGKPTYVNTPAFPDSGCVPLLTIHGENFHTTSTSMGHWSGGRLVLSEKPRRMKFDYAGLHEEFCPSPMDYQLAGDELLLCLHKSARTKYWEEEYTVRYVRVATEPTAEMHLLFELVMRDVLWANWDWESRTHKMTGAEGDR